MFFVNLDLQILMLLPLPSLVLWSCVVMPTPQILIKVLIKGKRLWINYTDQHHRNTTEILQNLAISTHTLVQGTSSCSWWAEEPVTMHLGWYRKTVAFETCHLSNIFCLTFFAFSSLKYSQSLPASNKSHTYSEHFWHPHINYSLICVLWLKVFLSP